MIFWQSVEKENGAMLIVFILLILGKIVFNCKGFIGGIHPFRSALFARFEPAVFQIFFRFIIIKKFIAVLAQCLVQCGHINRSHFIAVDENFAVVADGALLEGFLIGKGCINKLLNLSLELVVVPFCVVGR